MTCMRLITAKGAIGYSKPWKTVARRASAHRPGL